MGAFWVISKTMANKIYNRYKYRGSLDGWGLKALIVLHCPSISALRGQQRPLGALASIHCAILKAPIKTPKRILIYAPHGQRV